MKRPAWRDARMQPLPSTYVFALVEPNVGAIPPSVFVVRKRGGSLYYVVSTEAGDAENPFPPECKIVMWRRIAKDER